MKRWLKNHSHGWILSYFIVYWVWFCWLEKRTGVRFNIMHSKLDDFIPFNEYFIIPYVIWFFFIGWTIVYPFLKNREDFYRTCVYLFSGMTISLLICTIFPNATDLRTVVDPDKNIFCWLVSELHSADTATNVFPSIHVFNSIAACVCIFRLDTFRRFRHIRPIALFLTVMICLSTMFLKQHSVIDVCGGILLAAALYPMVFAGAGATEESTSPQTVRF